MKTRTPPLQGIPLQHQEKCIIAMQLLEAVDGARSLGLASLSIKDFTSDEFESMTYLREQYRKLK